MANRAIKNNNITDSNQESKKYKAYAMEESRLKEAKQLCEEKNDCFEYNRLGGNKRLSEVEKLVHQEQKKDELRRKTQKDTNPENMYKDTNSTNVLTPKVTKSANHNAKGAKSQILTNDQALNENVEKEIESIRYLIEYMNNNNKTKI